MSRHCPRNKKQGHTPSSCIQTHPNSASWSHSSVTVNQYPSTHPSLQQSMLCLLRTSSTSDKPICRTDYAKSGTTADTKTTCRRRRGPIIVLCYATGGLKMCSVIFPDWLFVGEVRANFHLRQWLTGRVAMPIGEPARVQPSTSSMLTGTAATMSSFRTWCYAHSHEQQGHNDKAHDSVVNNCSHT
jgi:hypothetical protein